MLQTLNKTSSSGLLKRTVGAVILALFFYVPTLPIDEELPTAKLLTYAEIRELYSKTEISPTLELRLNRLLTEAFVSNRSYSSKPDLKSSPLLGEFIRVAQWNIQRGLEFEALKAVLESEPRTSALIDNAEFPEGSSKRKQLLEQAASLRAADVIVLNEADWGMQRSEYRNIPEELAELLGWNYAFGVEFIELSPVHRGLDNRQIDGTIPVENVDVDRYKGLHGTAILSRFPLKNVQLIPYRTQAYDWYQEERKGVSFIEKGRRKLVKEIFLEKALKEVRRGGRNMLIAQIADPRFPAGVATIVATHIESRTSAKNRKLQLKELLDTIKPIRTPVVVAGDMNTSGNDMTPTSIARELKKRFEKPDYWVKTGINQVLRLGMLRDAVSATLTFGRNYGDPTVRDIPFIMPNEESDFFSLLKSFRFEDGGAFDFRGEELRSEGGRRNTLANSNERDGKGFVTTFRLPRPVKFIGRFKLDWIFVKPVHLFESSNYAGSYLLAPHFGRTLGAINSLVSNRISDHSPIIVDLPLAEPPIEKQMRKKR
jgi:endonuclease/exonuclease/phosphatase family metal-dependent hydrolase